MSILRVPVENLSEGESLLDKNASHYVLDVHRLGRGDELCLFDPTRGVEADAVVVRVDHRRVACQVENLRVSVAVPTRARVVVQAFGKGEKLDRVVRDATALGATRIVVVMTERSVVRLDERDASERRRRWQRIAIEAARQSGRGDIPRIEGPTPFGELGKVLGETDGVRLVLDPGAWVGLTEYLCQAPPNGVTVLVGPEGGLSSTEIAHSITLGFTPVRFGRFVLRTETATTAVLGALVGVDESSAHRRP